MKELKKRPLIFGIEIVNMEVAEDMARELAYSLAKRAYRLDIS